MGGDLTLALRTAQSGLLANQVALNAVANNVSNANTEGYSRKAVNLEQRVLGGNGAGVQLASLSRRIDDGLLNSYRTETTELKALQVQQSFLDRTQQLFGTPEGNSSLSHTLSQFTQAVESLAMAPNSALDQREVVRWADQLATQFNDMSAAIQDLRLEADQRIGEDVAALNDLIGEISELNDKIVRNNTSGRDVTDLRDRRDMALDKLSGLVDNQVFRRDDGDVVVFTTGGRVLVDNVSANLSHAAAARVSATTTHAEGDFGGIYAGAALPQNDITTEIKGGELKGLIDLRDSILPDMQSTLDELAATVRDTVNQVHNRGVAFPGLQEMNGSRTFVDPANQEITFSGDVKVVLFDAAGDQVRAGSLTTLLGGTNSGTIAEVRDALNAVLGADGTAAVDPVDGHLSINVSGPGLHLALRDEDAGGGAGDVSIAFDADADGSTDETVAGFSNFFGLNDVFVDHKARDTVESDVLVRGFAAPADATLRFAFSGGAPATTVAVSQGDSLEQMVAVINGADAGVTASLVPDGAGVRLRITADSAEGLSVTADAPALPAALGMHAADAGVAGTLEVRADIAARPSLLSRGTVQAKSMGATTRYFASVGDDSAVQSLAATLTTAQSFDAAGGLGTIAATVSRYAADIIADNASLADGNKRQLDYQESLVTSLKAESDGVRGVNLDEEMADLILYEQAYAASARLIGVVQNMFEALEQAVR